MGIKIKKGQITIFIILAILVVIGIIAFILLMREPSIEVTEGEDPKQVISKCVRDAVEESAIDVLAGGGRIEPEFYKEYDSKKYNYLCYNQNYYVTCINHYPQLVEIIEEEIKDNTQQDVEACFDALQQELEAEGYSVSYGSIDYDVELVPAAVLIKLNREMDISRGDFNQNYEKFDSRILSQLYGLSFIASEIVNQESQYCNFEYNGFMLLYPRYEIKRKSYDESRLYNIIDRNSGEEFKFAVRSCALPPGF